MRQNGQKPDKIWAYRMVTVIDPAKLQKATEYFQWKYAIGERDGCLERLSPDVEEKFRKNHLTLKELKQIAYFFPFSRGVTILVGPAGTGKTLSMTAILYHLRKFFGMHTITDYELKPAYGPYSYLSTEEFIQELRNVDALVKLRKERISDFSSTEITERVGEAAETILRNRGIVFDNAGIGWDEANRKLERTRSTSKLVMMHRYYVQTWRHYQCALILATPELDDIVEKALTQVTIELGCGYDTVLGECTAMGRNRITTEPVVLRTYMRNYKDMYETHAPISIRESILSFKDLKL